MEASICMVDKVAKSRKKKGLEIGTGQRGPSSPYGAPVRIMRGENT